MGQAMRMAGDAAQIERRSSAPRLPARPGQPVGTRHLAVGAGAIAAQWVMMSRLANRACAAGSSGLAQRLGDATVRLSRFGVSSSFGFGHW
jgi:hypothetical protein